MSALPTGALRATLGLDTAQFETRARAAAKAAGGMASGMSRAFEVARGAALGHARSIDDLRASLDPAFAATQRYAAIQRAVAALVEGGAASQRAANLVLEQAAARYMGVETAAETAARVQRETGAAVDSATRSYRSLLATINPVYAASKQYEAAQETVSAAVRQGVVSQEEANRTLEMAARKYLAADAAAESFTAAAARTAGGSTRIAQAAANASFQIQDFAVQVAAGTSATTALAQQLPQLLGAFGFVGRIALLGSLLGTAVAVASAVVPAFLRSADAAGSAGTALEGLNSALNDYSRFAETAGTSTEALREKFGDYGETVRRTAEYLAQVSVSRALDALQTESSPFLGGLNDAVAAVEALTEATARYNALSAGTSEQMLQAREVLAGFHDQAMAAAEAVGLVPAQVAALNEAFDGLSGAASMVEIRDRSEEALAVIRQFYPEGARLPPALAEAADQLGRVNAAAASGVAQMTSASAAASALAGQITTAANAAVGLRMALAGAEVALGALGLDVEEKIGVLRARNAALQAGANEATAGEIRLLELKRAEIAKGLAAGGATLDQIAAQTAGVTAQIEEYEALLSTNEQLRASVKATGSAGSGAGKAVAQGAEVAANGLDAARKEAERLADSLHENVVSAISESVNGAVDWMLDGFKGGFKGLFDIAKDTLKQIIGLYAKNRITLALGMGGSVGGLAGTAAAATGAAPAGGGLMGNLGMLGQIGGIGSAFMGGIGLSGSALMSGGIGGMFSTIGAQVGTAVATGTMTSIAAAVGAIALPLAGLAAVISFFGSKTKLLDAGLRITVQDMDALVETFKKVEKSKFWGLSKSTRLSYSAASAEVSDPILKAVAEIQGSIVEAADSLGVGTDAFRTFAASVQISTKGLSDAEIQAAVEEQMTKLGDSFASLAFGFSGTNDALIADLRKQVEAYDATKDAAKAFGEDGPVFLGNGLKTLQKQLDAAIAANAMVAGDAAPAALIKEGEGAAAALSRLATSLTTVNAITDTLGHAFKAVDLLSAGIASDIAEAFGGLDAMAAATTAYYNAFYTDSERVATATRQATAALADFGATMPRTRAQYRAMIEAIDLTTASGQKLYAQLIGMSEVFDMILPAVTSFTVKIAAMVGTITTDIDAMIAEATEAQRAGETAAKAWYATAKTLRDFVSDMHGTASALVSPRQARAFAEARYQSTLASAMAGDAEAAKAITGAAGALLDNTQATARTAVDVARAQARVLSDLSLLAGVTAVEGAREDVLAGLASQQVDLLKEVRDYLNSGGTLDPAQIDALNGQLGSLESAIAAVKDISYAALRERIDVTVDLLATANIPADLRRILSTATNSITANIDMVLRSNELTPDLMWLALNASSEHLANVTYIAKATRLPRDLRRLAATTTLDLTRVLNLTVGRRLPPATMRLALAGNSTLTRTVTATLAASISPKAKRLALGNVGAYAVAVEAALSPKIGDKIRRIVFGGAGSYTAMIEAAIGGGMGERARRILLRQQGRYIASITGVLASAMPPAVKRLLLQANTSGARAVTLSAAFAGRLSPAEREALRASGVEVERTVRASVRLGELGRVQRRALMAETGAITRTIRGIVRTGRLTTGQRALLDAIDGSAEGTVTLGGSFRFDPSRGFQSWYEGTTRTLIQSPIQNLRSSLSNLREAVLAETARARAETLKEARIAAAQAAAQKAYTEAQAAAAKVAASVAAVNAFDAATGGELVNRTGEATAAYVNEDGRARLDAVGVASASAADLARWQRIFWAEGGLEDRMQAANRAANAADRALAAARRAVIAASGVPAFAGGGAHAGGLRLVGEHGPELEATGPARIYSAGQTVRMLKGEDAAMVAELRALRAELAALREEQRQLGMQTVTNTGRGADTLRKFDRDGLPAERA